MAAVTVYIHHHTSPEGRPETPVYYSFTEPSTAGKKEGGHWPSTHVRGLLIRVPDGAAWVLGEPERIRRLWWSYQGISNIDDAEDVLVYAKEGRFGFGVEAIAPGLIYQSILGRWGFLICSILVMIAALSMGLTTFLGDSTAGWAALIIGSVSAFAAIMSLHRFEQGDHRIDRPHERADASRAGCEKSSQALPTIDGDSKRRFPE